MRCRSLYEHQRVHVRYSSKNRLTAKPTRCSSGTDKGLLAAFAKVVPHTSCLPLPQTASSTRRNDRGKIEWPIGDRAANRIALASLCIRNSTEFLVSDRKRRLGTIRARSSARGFESSSPSRWSHCRKGRRGIIRGSLANADSAVRMVNGVILSRAFRAGGRLSLPRQVAEPEALGRTSRGCRLASVDRKCERVARCKANTRSTEPE